MSLQEQVIGALRRVYDPEIPVNVYELGLIYGLEADEAGENREIAAQPDELQPLADDHMLRRFRNGVLIRESVRRTRLRPGRGRSCR